MKLLSASAVVAGANSVALADCGLCGGSGHDYSACSGFDYLGYARSIGYYGNLLRPEGTPLTEGDMVYLGQLAANDTNKARVAKYFHASSSIVSFPTSSSDVASLNSWNNTETTPKNSDEKPSASDKINTLKLVASKQDLGDRDTAISESDVEQIAEQMRREEAALKIQKARRAQLARRKREEARREREAREETERAEAVQHLFGEDNMKTLARERDTKELKNMLAERRETARNLNGLGKTLDEKNKYYINELYGIEGLEANAHMRGAEEARSVAEENREKINISEDDKLDIKVRNILDGEQKKRERVAAKKIQNAVRARLARRKAAELKAEADREKIQEHRKNAAARKLTELRANKERRKERREAERQAQIDSDYELAKKLQAEYDAEDAQIRAERRQAQIESDRQLAEQLHAEEVAAQIAEDHRLAEQTQEKFDEERRVAAMPRQQEEFRQRAVGDSEAVETDRWSLPESTKFKFNGFDFNYRGFQRQAESWASQLKDLSIRKVECVLWLVALSYWDLLQAGGETDSSEIYEAVCEVKDIFPKTGPEVKVNPAIMNVYNAFENTSPAKFEEELATLGYRELNGVLYFVAQQYAKLLQNGKKAADEKFIKLAKFAVEHFDRAWEAEDAEVFEESEAPEAESSGSAVVTENRQAPAVSATTGVQGIVETEAPETTTWDMPYRVYYAYCNEIRHGLRPTRKSMQYYKDPELFREDLRKLTVRRLEALIRYLANLDLATLDGSRLGSDTVADLTKDIANVEEKEKNPRVLNVFEAFKNMVDHPNDNSISMQPFGKGFRALTASEKAYALGDIAVAYRKKLRSGSRPASLTFVKWADEVCKALQLDGFLMGKDNEHPEWKFEEFENGAKTLQVSDTANANNNPAVTTDDGKEAPDSTLWMAPKNFQSIFRSYESRDDGLGQFQKHIERLTVRQQEALIYKTISVYVEQLGAGRVCDLSPDLDGAIRAVYNRLKERKGDRLMNVVRASACARAFESEVEEMFERFNEQAFRYVEKLLAAIVQVYKEKLDGGAKPADKVFTDLVRVVFEVFGLDGGKYSEENNPNPKALGDNSKEKEIRTNDWRLPIYMPNRMQDINGEDYDWYDINGWEEKLAYLNVRQLEVLLVEFAQVCVRNRFGVYDPMGEKMEAVLEAYNNLNASGNNATVAEFRSAMDKAHGKNVFDDDAEGQASVGRRYVYEALESVIGEYIRKLNTASPVTEEFRRAVMGH